MLEAYCKEKNEKIDLSKGITKEIIADFLNTAPAMNDCNKNSKDYDNFLNILHKACDIEKMHNDKFVLYHAANANVAFFLILYNLLLDRLQQSKNLNEIRYLRATKLKANSIKDILISQMIAQNIEDSSQINNYSGGIGFENIFLATNVGLFGNKYKKTSFTPLFLYNASSVAAPYIKWLIQSLCTALGTPNSFEKYENIYQTHFNSSSKNSILLQIFVDPSIIDNLLFLCIGAGSTFYSASKANLEVQLEKFKPSIWLKKLRENPEIFIDEISKACGSELSEAFDMENIQARLQLNNESWNDQKKIFIKNYFLAPLKISLYNDLNNQIKKDLIEVLGNHIEIDNTIFPNKIGYLENYKNFHNSIYGKNTYKSSSNATAALLTAINSDNVTVIEKMLEDENFDINKQIPNKEKKLLHPIALALDAKAEKISKLLLTYYGIGEFKYFVSDDQLKQLEKLKSESNVFEAIRLGNVNFFRGLKNLNLKIKKNGKSVLELVYKKNDLYILDSICENCYETMSPQEQENFMLNLFEFLFKTNKSIQFSSCPYIQDKTITPIIQSIENDNPSILSQNNLLNKLFKMIMENNKILPIPMKFILEGKKANYMRYMIDHFFNLLDYKPKNILIEFAVRTNDLDRVEYLFNSKNLNISDFYVNNYPLHVAFENNSKEVLEFLIQKCITQNLSINEPGIKYFIDLLKECICNKDFEKQALLKIASKLYPGIGVYLAIINNDVSELKKYLNNSMFNIEKIREIMEYPLDVAYDLKSEKVIYEIINHFINKDCSMYSQFSTYNIVKHLQSENAIDSLLEDKEFFRSIVKNVPIEFLLYLYDFCSNKSNFEGIKPLFYNRFYTEVEKLSSPNLKKEDRESLEIFMLHYFLKFVENKKDFEQILIQLPWMLEQKFSDGLSYDHNYEKFKHCCENKTYANYCWEYLFLWKNKISSFECVTKTNWDPFEKSNIKREDELSTFNLLNDLDENVIMYVLKAHNNLPEGKKLKIPEDIKNSIEFNQTLYQEAISGSQNLASKN